MNLAGCHSGETALAGESRISKYKVLSDSGQAGMTVKSNSFNLQDMSSILKLKLKSLSQ